MAASPFVLVLSPFHSAQSVQLPQVLNTELQLMLCLKLAFVCGFGRCPAPASETESRDCVTEAEFKIAHYRITYAPVVCASGPC